VHPGSAIPQSFELTLQNGQKVWVHGNATEHIAEYAAMKAQSYTPEAVRLASQAQIESFSAAVNSATKNGIQYSRLQEIDGWELKFAPPRSGGLAPVVIHALYRN
jgi:filamentous hemagglutinin